MHFPSALWLSSATRYQMTPDFNVGCLSCAVTPHSWRSNPNFPKYPTSPAYRSCISISPAVCSLQYNYRSCILSLVQWRSYDHNHHTSEVDDLLRCLGQRIRDVRKQRGWSQTAASEHIGVHWTYLGHLERAEKPGVSVMSIARIANAFGVTLADMFAGLEQGEALNPTGKPFRQPDTLIRVGKNAIKIEALIEELRLERAALKETVRALKLITGASVPSGHQQPSPKQQRS